MTFSIKLVSLFLTLLILPNILVNAASDDDFFPAFFSIILGTGIHYQSSPLLNTLVSVEVRNRIKRDLVPDELASCDKETFTEALEVLNETTSSDDFGDRLRAKPTLAFAGALLVIMDASLNDWRISQAQGLENDEAANRNFQAFHILEKLLANEDATTHIEYENPVFFEAFINHLIDYSGNNPSNPKFAEFLLRFGGMENSDIDRILGPRVYQNFPDELAVRVFIGSWKESPNRLIGSLRTQVSSYRPENLRGAAAICRIFLIMNPKADLSVRDAIARIASLSIDTTTANFERVLVSHGPDSEVSLEHALTFSHVLHVLSVLVSIDGEHAASLVTLEKATHWEERVLAKNRNRFDLRYTILDAKTGRRLSFISSIGTIIGNIIGNKALIDAKMAEMNDRQREIVRQEITSRWNEMPAADRTSPSYSKWLQLFPFLTKAALLLGCAHLFNF